MVGSGVGERNDFKPAWEDEVVGRWAEAAGPRGTRAGEPGSERGPSPRGCPSDAAVSEGDGLGGHCRDRASPPVEKWSMRMLSRHVHARGP